MGMSQEAVGKNGIDALCVGAMDCAVNCNLALINVGKARPDWDSAHLSLFNNNDPGAGAITPYHNGTTTVEANIPAGGELFKFYGNKWYVLHCTALHCTALHCTFGAVLHLQYTTLVVIIIIIAAHPTCSYSQVQDTNRRVWIDSLARKLYNS
jgi:hypothetical protein